MKRKVITLCGSSRFKKDFEEEAQRLTLEGNVVISLGVFSKSSIDNIFDANDEEMRIQLKDMLDDIHKQKIDMADEIFVINKDGYIGKSTWEEIQYAISKNKLVRFMENESLKYFNYSYYLSDKHKGEMIEKVI